MGEQERGLNSMKAKFGFRKRVKTYIICLVLLFVGVLGSIFISEEDYGNWKFKIRQIDIDKILEYFDIKTNTVLSCFQNNEKATPLIFLQPQQFHR